MINIPTNSCTPVYVDKKEGIFHLNRGNVGLFSPTVTYRLRFDVRPMVTRHLIGFKFELWCKHVIRFRSVNIL